MKNLPVWLFSILCFVNILSAQTDETIIGPYRFTGKVEDSKGLPIAGINLYFQKGDYSRTFATDIKGEFDARLQPGRYEISVNKKWSASFRAFISITEAGPNPDKIVFVIHPSSACCSSSSDGNPFPKPLVLPKPPFPPAARAVRAFGEVEVAVTIEPDGTVSAAKAISGHPLLRATSVAAARSASFESGETKSQRELVLTYLYLAPDEKNKNILRYSNPYLIEIISAPSTIEY
ncbi:MAG TPA: energy transducer TonB, partial [Pyrinomonadaceae bacterium]|nr:energy transducer TonB [Pyrinomonadaceae bacterium]